MRRINKTENQSGIPSEPQERTLQATLSYMRAKVILIVWDTVWGIILVCLPIAYLGSSDFSLALRTLCITAGSLLAGHLAFTLYYDRYSYQKKLVRITKKYLDIGNEALYLEALEQNLQEKMIFRSRQFVLSADYILGYADSDLVFRPAAIPICTITEAEFHLRHVEGRKARSQGILTCSLRNGRRISFYTSFGPGITEVLQALDAAGFVYEKNL